MNVRIDAAVLSGFTNSRRAGGKPSVEIGRSLLPLLSAFWAFAGVLGSILMFSVHDDPSLNVADASASASLASRAA